MKSDVPSLWTAVVLLCLTGFKWELSTVFTAFDPFDCHVRLDKHRRTVGFSKVLHFCFLRFEHLVALTLARPVVSPSDNTALLNNLKSGYERRSTPREEEDSTWQGKTLRGLADLAYRFMIPCLCDAGTSPLGTTPHWSRFFPSNFKSRAQSCLMVFPHFVPQSKYFRSGLALLCIGPCTLNGL